MLYTLMLPTLLIPLVGLAVDVSILYIVQTQLSIAVDGAALGGGRLLGTNANTSEIAGEFLRANFPTGFWGSYNLVPNITVTHTFSNHTITVSARVDVPLRFLRIFRQNFSTVAASAQSTRRDSRIVLVLDRSYSMRNNIGALRTAATTFTNMFNPGVDKMGLVVYGGSAFVAYPTTRPYSLTAGTGPNEHFADAPASGSDNMLTMIDAMRVGSDTNTSEGLWLAYQELKKSYALDLDNTRLNAIVLFTDGIPNGFTAWFNDPANNSLGSNSNCTYNPATSNALTRMIGWWATVGNSSDLSYFNPTTSKGIGIYNALIFDTTHTAKYWMNTIGGNGYVDDMVDITGTPMTNCQHISAGGSMGEDSDMSGLYRIPPQDYYGTSTTGTGYTNGILYQRYQVGYDSTKPTNGYHVGLASWNVVDNTARRILADATMNIAIYCIGYSGNGGVDAPLLKRVANTQNATNYNTAYQSGLYVEAADTDALQRAFTTVGSAILRLSQ